MIRHLSRLGTLLLALLVVASTSACAADRLEIVQSVPVETTLAVPGVRLAQDVWLELINGAQSTLDLEQYYVSDQAGEALEPVLKAITAAAGRGVHVRLMVDAAMYKTYPDSVNQLGAVANIEARTIDFSNYGGIQHAKFFVVDGKQSFIGSQNFDWRALDQIHEIGVRVTDTKVAQDCETIFEKDWQSASSLSAKSALATSARVLSAAPATTAPAADFYVAASPAQANPPGIPDTATQVITMIGNARSSVRIEVMEYTTINQYAKGNAIKVWTALDDAIRAAARRGVNVQLLVDSSKVKSAKKQLTSLAALPNVEVRAVTIPQWSGGPIDYARLIHAKYLIVDGRTAWVGSENWSPSYFLNTRNVGLVIDTQNQVDQLGQVFNQVWTSAYASEIK